MNSMLIDALRARLSVPLLFVAACGGTVSASGAFSAHYPDNRADAVAAAASDVSTASSPAAVDVALAVSASGSGVIGFDPASGAVAYRNPATTNFPTAIAGSSGVIETAGTLRVIDLRTGEQRASIDLGRDSHLIGCGAGGDRLAISIVRGTGTLAHARLVLVHGGRVTDDLAVDRPIGVPAIAGERVLVPWAYQNLSVLDFDGDELARVRLRSGVVGHVLVDRGRVWFGATSLFRFDASSANDAPTGYTPPDLGVERAPNLLPNAYEAPAPLSSAGYKVRLSFAVDPSSEELVPADSTLYLVHYRFLFALDARTAETRWVRVLPGDVVGVRASVGGVRVASDTGDVLTLRATDGRIIASGSIGERVTSVTFPYLASIPSTEPIDAERPDVRAQLYQAVETADARLVTAREYALTRLAALPDDDATSDLGVLCEDERLPARTRTKACELLSGRATGAAHVEAQLRRRGSFLDERPHPPVAALARAAASMHDAAAAPLLVEQLDDPRTPIGAIPAIASSIIALQYAAAAPSLAMFLRTYHADNAEEGIVDALAAVADAYGRLGGETALVEIETLARDPLAPPPLATCLRDAAARLRTELHVEAPSTPSTPTTTPAATAAVALPTHITMDMASPVLAPVQTALSACLRADPAHPGSARVIVVVSRDGTVAEVHATPASTEACLRERVAPLRFPATRGAGQTTRLTTTVRAN